MTEGARGVDDDPEEHTVIVDGRADEAEAEERTVIVEVDDPDERTVIVAPDEPDEPDAPDEPDESDTHTVIVAPDEDDSTSIVAPADPAGAPAPGGDDDELSAPDERAGRRVVRSSRLEREPLRPMPVPPGRHGPLLPGSGAGAVFVSDIRPVPASAPPPERPAPVTTLRAEVPSVAVASRRTAVVALVTASVSVLVSLIGLAWIVRTILGA